MLDFNQAREAAVKAEEPHWDGQYGTLYADTTGYTDGGVFAVIMGPEEWLVDGELEYMMMDAPMALVNIKNGEVKRTTYLEDPDRIDRMTPVRA